MDILASVCLCFVYACMCASVSVCKAYVPRSVLSVCDFNCVCELLAWSNVDEMSTSGQVAKSAGDINRLFTGLWCLFLASDVRGGHTASQHPYCQRRLMSTLVLLHLWLTAKTSTDVVCPPKCKEAKDVIQGFLVVGQNKHSFGACISSIVTTTELGLGVPGVISKIIFRPTKSDNSTDQQLWL